MSPKSSKTKATKPVQKRSKPRHASNGSSTIIKGNVNGMVLSGNVQGSLKIDNRKIKAQNYIEGGKGHRITVGTSAKDIGQLFAMLNQRVGEIKSPEERKEAKEAVAKLEVESKKGEKADESKVKRWLNFLADVAPDVWEVAVDTLSNPLKGVSTVFRKVAERAKAEKS